MKFRKSKKFHTVESYSSCICVHSTCSCSCSVCVCGCNGTIQPSATDRADGRDDARSNIYSSEYMRNMSSQNLQL